MKLENRINVLLKIGNIFSELINDHNTNSNNLLTETYNNNTWFSTDYIIYSLKTWTNNLTKDNITTWLAKYNISDHLSDKTIGIIMAGNIPLVGFHDFICAYICGFKMQIKLSSKDNILSKWIIDKFIEHDTTLKERIFFTDNIIKKFDAIIATGNDNTYKYFEHYFDKYPRILRKNRNSVAIIDGTETKEDLELLADDVFIYYGLGCRNVSKLFVPTNYDFNNMGLAFQKYINVIINNKYANNFDYQYALIALNKTLHINFNNILLIENNNISSPISVLYYEYYDDLKTIKENITQNKDKIQCVVGNKTYIDNCINFGTTQTPNLHDYADNIDTIKFILNIDNNDNKI